MTLKRADFPKICRMCLLMKKDMLTLYVPEVMEMVINCIGIEIKLNDGLPQTICGECSNQIQQFSTFRQQCKNSDLILHKIVNEDTNSDSFCDTNIKKELSNDIKKESINTEESNVAFIIKTELDDISESTCNKFASHEDYVKDENFNSNESDENNCNQTENKSELNNKVILKNVRKKLKKQKCDVCSKTFRKPCELAKHLTDVHKRKKTLECQVCSKTFHLQVQLDLHLKLHFKTRHICNVCGKEFGESSKLKRHQKIHKKREQIFCLHCDKSFLTDDSYRRHVKVYHTESGAIVRKTCPICGKAVIDVDLHIKYTHDKSKTFKCDQCDKSFSFNHLLTNHIEEKHLGIKRELKALCFICGKACLNQGELKKHLPMHDENREYTCTLCNKKYKSRNGLQRHIKRHKGIRPYECTFCSKKYLEKIHLDQHLHSHTGERPFACHICGRTFSYKAARWTHMKVHNVFTGDTKNHDAFESTNV